MPGVAGVSARATSPDITLEILGGQSYVEFRLSCRVDPEPSSSFGMLLVDVDEGVSCFRRYPSIIDHCVRS